MMVPFPGPSGAFISIPPVNILMVLMDANQVLEEYRKGRRDFSSIRLANANLSGVSLAGIIFNNSNLTATSFMHSDMSNADFSNCHLSRCTFSGAILKGTNFQNADLSYANFKGAYFEATTFNSANLMWAHLCESDLARSIIDNANLTWSCLIGSTLSEEQLKTIPQTTLTTIAFAKPAQAAGAYKQEGVAGISGYGHENREQGLYVNPQPKEKKKQEWC